MKHTPVLAGLPGKSTKGYKKILFFHFVFFVCFVVPFFYLLRHQYKQALNAGTVNQRDKCKLDQIRLYDIRRKKASFISPESDFCYLTFQAMQNNL
jgi:hypothetical protein